MPHIPTGIVQIDTLLGGELTEDKKSLICPGLPRGRIGELYGAESSGKTTLALKFIAQVQKAGGTAIFLDYEHALDQRYAKSIGVNLDELLIYQPETFEDGLKIIYMAAKQNVDLVVTDSVSAMVTAEEMERKIDKAAKVGSLAGAMARWLPKMVQWLDKSSTVLLYINQVRALIAAGSHETENTSGGKALKFFCSFRLKTTRIRSDFVERKDPITLKKKRFPYGNVTSVKCVKNKMVGHQNHTAEIFIRYGTGVDEYLSLVESAIPRKIITQSGSKYKWGSQEFSGKEKVRKFLVENPKAFEEIRAAVMKALMEEAPVPAQGDDEIEDSEIMSDFSKEFGDDDFADLDGGTPAVEEALVEGPEES
jgi:recombination protein RecA